jgi:hypothetical protein
LARSFFDNSPDGNELDFIRIADDHLVQQRRAGRVIVAVGKSRHNRHAPGVVGLGVLPRERLDLCGTADREESAGFHRERLGARRRAVDGVNLGVGDDQIGVLRIGVESRRQYRWAFGDVRRGGEPGQPGAGEPEHFAAAMVAFSHRY